MLSVFAASPDSANAIMFFESFWLNCTVAISLIVALTFDYVTKFFSYWYIRHVPYKLSIPFYGGDYHRILGLRSNTQEVNALYKNYKGDFVGSLKSRMPDLIVKNPDIVKEVLSTNFENFKSRGVDLDKSRDVCLRNNLFYAEGEKWTLLREGLVSMLDDFKISEDGLLECLSGTNGDVNVQELLAQVLDIVFKNLLLKDVDENVIADLRKSVQKRTLIDKFKSYLKSIFPSVYTLFGLSTLVGQPTYKTIKTLQNAEISKKLSTIFRLDEKENVKSLKTNPDDLTFGVLSSFITEGYIPTLNVLTALFYELAKNPQFQERAKFSSEHLDAAVKETLRLHSPYSVITRKCVKAYKFLDSQILIDRGVTVNVPVDAIHKDDAYFREAEVFKPERFLDSSVRGYTFLPFGAGPRKCIGEFLIISYITLYLTLDEQVQHSILGRTNLGL